jgi:hypothetical protein
MAANKRERRRNKTQKGDEGRKEGRKGREKGKGNEESLAGQHGKIRVGETVSDERESERE